MSAYIYKLRSPTRFSWMNVQVNPDITVTVKVYHMKFWYKPYAGMEEDNKLQKKLSREEKKTKKLFENTDVRYAITSYEGHDIGKSFVHGDFFGCWQVVDWKRLKKIEGEIIDYPLNTNRILFNDESFSNIWCKAVLASKEDIYDQLTSPGNKVLA